MAKDDGLSEIDRATLLSLADDPCIEGVWTKLVRSYSREIRVVRRFFIREIVCNLKLAAKVESWPDHLRHAEICEHLASFFRGEGGLPRPLPGRVCGTCRFSQKGR